MIMFAVILGIVSGLYPAMYLSAFSPQRVLSGLRQRNSGAGIRTTLVGVQITVSIFLIASTVLVFRQLNYLGMHDLGYDKENIIMLTIRGTKIPSKYYAFRDQLLSYADVESISSVSEPIGREVQFMSFRVDNHVEPQFIKILNVGFDFTKTMGLSVIEGRDFSRDIISDSTDGFLINEAAARKFGWADPIGKPIQHSFKPGPMGQVIGVIKDFNFEPLHNQVDPVVLFKGYPAFYAAVRVNTHDLPATVARLEKTWKEFEPDKPFNMHFLDQSIQNVYDKEQRIGKVFLLFATLSILTAAMGLFGLVSFIVDQRRAEIGIRKVLGASVTEVVGPIARQYAVLTIIGVVIAAPVTYLVTNRWLENFAFRISFNPIYIVLAFAITLTVVMLTVLKQSLSAAKADPVKSLRME